MPLVPGPGVAAVAVVMVVRVPVVVVLVELLLDAVQHVGEVLELAAQVVAGDGVADRGADAGDLAGQELRVGLRLRGAAAVLRGQCAVAVLLPVLRQQDERRGVRGLGGERQATTMIV